LVAVLPLEDKETADEAAETWLEADAMFDDGGIMCAAGA
jgi:hypothetical protein